MKLRISYGEAWDKLSILSIKRGEAKDDIVLNEINKEFLHIMSELISSLYHEEEEHRESVLNLYDNLLAVNKKLWKIEDRIRLKEDAKEFDDEFISLARSVYKTNDIRHKIKSDINNLTNSDFKEQKIFTLEN